MIELEKIPHIGEISNHGLYHGARQKNTATFQARSTRQNKLVPSLEEAKALQAQHGGFIKTMWCGDEACEIKMKEEGGMTSRCVPFAQEHLGDTCPICGRAAKKMIYWGVAY